MLLTYPYVCLILQNLATQIILVEESKLRYSSCRLLSYISDKTCVCVCVCVHARMHACVRVTELKKILFCVKMLDWFCISSYIVYVKTADIG